MSGNGGNDLKTVIYQKTYPMIDRREIQKSPERVSSFWAQIYRRVSYSQNLKKRHCMLIDFTYCTALADGE